MMLLFSWLSCSLLMFSSLSFVAFVFVVLVFTVIFVVVVKISGIKFLRGWGNLQKRSAQLFLLSLSPKEIQIHHFIKDLEIEGCTKNCKIMVSHHVGVGGLTRLMNKITSLGS